MIILDSGFKTNSISAEIIAIINENCFKYLKNKPIRITVPDTPEPASYGLTKYYYQNKEFILKKIADILKVKTKKFYAQKAEHHDVPPLLKRLEQHHQVKKEKIEIQILKFPKN